MEFTEQETLQDALIGHKYLMSMYNQFQIECSNKSIRKLLNELYLINSEQNLKLYNIMNEKGFYPKTMAAQKDVKQAVKMHTQMQEQLEKKLKK